MASQSTTEIKEEDGDDQNENAADFEKAIEATGRGIFNYFLLLAATTGAFANTFATTTMSYVLPIAECDLKLSLEDKGLLNAATYTGMIVSSIFWGYLADTKGRRKILVYCYFGDAACVLISSLSQNTAMLVTFKVLSGIIVNGPSSTLYTYFCEMHSKEYRSQVVMFIGMMVSLSTLVLPLLAWGLFPRDWNFSLFGSLNVHSWQIYLFFCSLPSLVSALLIIFLPESPKFLMSQGRNAEALKSFQKMFSVNKRQPKENYPIKNLVEETRNSDKNSNNVFTIESNENNTEKVSKNRDFMQSLCQGFKQMKPLFRKPLVGHALHIIALQFTALLTFNTIRLWLPQLFASFAEYESKYSEETTNLCNVLAYSVNRTASIASDYHQRCLEPQPVPTQAYMNNVIVGISSTMGFFFGDVIIRFIGLYNIITFGLLTLGIFQLSLYWSSSNTITLIIMTAFLTVGSVATSGILGIVVDLFPTSLRNVMVAVSLMFGRVGALSGNMLFPFLMKTGCIPPLVFLCFVSFSASALSGFLRKTKNTSVT